MENVFYEMVAMVLTFLLSWLALRYFLLDFSVDWFEWIVDWFTERLTDWMKYLAGPGSEPADTIPERLRNRLNGGAR